MKEEIMAVIKAIKNGSVIEEEDHLIEGGLLSSLELLMLISELEKMYNITIPVEEVLPANFDTVNAILALVNRRKIN